MDERRERWCCHGGEWLRLVGEGGGINFFEFRFCFSDLVFLFVLTN